MAGRPATPGLQVLLQRSGAKAKKGRFLGPVIVEDRRRSA
jgi:hypothetical protein